MDPDTFLTTVHVLPDGLLEAHPFGHSHPGPRPSLSLYASEVVTLAVIGQWYRFPTERTFYRYADHHLRRAVPHLPPIASSTAWCASTARLLAPSVRT